MNHNQAAIDLLTTRLATGLIHPGNPDNNQPPIALPMPGLTGHGIPDEMATQFAAEAGLPTNDLPRLVAEAIIVLLETELAGGSTIITNHDLDQLRQDAAATPTGTRLVAIHCHCDNTLSNPLLELPLGNRDHITINGGLLLRGLAQRSPDCPHTTVNS